MIQFIKNLTESNNNLASAIKTQTEQEKHNAGKMREVVAKLDMIANLNDQFLQTLKEQVEKNIDGQEGFTGKLDEFLSVLTSFFAFQKSQELRKREAEEELKPTKADMIY